MMNSISISDRVLNVLDELEPGDTLDEKLTRLAEAELRRRLARYQLTDRQFRGKYGVSLDEFESQDIVSDRNNSFEVQSDYQDWDLALDGIRSTERQLSRLLEKS
jgi:hypothetical protein